MDEKQLQLLYNSYGKNKGFKDFNEFKSLMSDDNSRKVFFESSNEEMGFKDLNEFDNLLGLKKKDGGGVSSQTSSETTPLVSEAPSTSNAGAIAGQAAESITQPIELDSNQLFSLHNEKKGLENAITQKKQSAKSSSYSASSLTPTIAQPMESTDSEENRLKTINQSLKNAGYNPEIVNKVLDGIPPDAPNVDAAALIKESQENELSFQRQKATHIWQPKLFKNIREKEGENGEAVVESILSGQTNAQSLEDVRENMRYTISQVRKYVDDEDEQNKIIKQIVTDKSIGYAFVTPEQLMQDAKYQNGNLNIYQVHGLNWLQDTNPEAARSFERLMSVTPDTEAGIRGQQIKAKELELYGLGLINKGVQERLISLANKHKKLGALSEQETKEYEYLYGQYEQIKKEFETQKDRYPIATVLDADAYAQEALSMQRNGAGRQAALGVGEEVDDVANFVGDFLMSPFRSKEERIVDDLEDYGDKKLSQGSSQYVLDKNSLVTRPYVLAYDKDLADEIELVKNDKSLTDDERLEKTRLLIARNFDKTGFLPKDSKFNFTANAWANAVSDVGSQLFAQISIGYLTGGVGNISKLKQLSNLFGTVYATAYNDYYTEAMDKNIENPSTYATLHTAIEAASELIHNDYAMVQKLVNPKSSLGQVLKNVTKEQWDAIVKSGSSKFKKFGKAMLESGKQSLNMSRKETIEEAAGQITSNAANIEVYNEDIAIEHGLKETVITTFLGMLPLGLVGVGGQYGKINRSQQYALYEAAQNKDKVLAQLEKDVANGVVKPKDAEKIKTYIDAAAKELGKAEGKTDNEKAHDLTQKVVSVIMPDENKRPEVIAPKKVEQKKGASVIMPGEIHNPLPITPKPKEQAPEVETKGAKVILPQSNVAPNVVENKKVEINEAEPIQQKEEGKEGGMLESPQNPIEEARSYADDIKADTYKQVFIDDTEIALKEIAQQLNSSKGEAETTRNVFGDRISDLALKVFPNEKPAPAPKMPSEIEETQTVTEVKSTKDVSKAFTRLLKDELESEDYGIHGLLADWGAEYDKDSDKLIFEDTRSGTGKWRKSKKDFINWILSGEAEKELPTIKEYINGLKGIINNEVGVKELSQPKKKPLSANQKKAATIDDLTLPHDIVLRHFAKGGKIKPDVISRLFGNKKDKSTEGEKRLRISLMSKDGSTIEQIAHQLWEDHPEHDTQTYKDAIEQVIQGYTSQEAMAKDLVDRYINQSVKQDLTEQEAAEIDEKSIAKRVKIVEELPENQQKELLGLLAKYEDRYGFIDWEKLEADTNGFDPEILSLSNDTSKVLDEIINKNISKAESQSSNTTDKDGDGSQEKTGEEEAVKAKSKLQQLADKIEKDGILPDFLKANLPDGTQKLGWDSKAYNKAIAEALRAVDSAINKGIELAKAIEEGFQHIKDYYEKHTKNYDVERIRKEFAFYVADNGVASGVRHQDTSEIRGVFGLDPYRRTMDTTEEWEKEADGRLEADGIEPLLKKLKSSDHADKIMTEVEQVMLDKYIATLKREVALNPSNENLSKLKEALELNDLEGTKWGRLGRARQDRHNPLSDLGDFYVAKMEANSVDELTDEQKEEVRAQFAEYETKLAEERRLREEAEAYVARLKAEREMGRVKRDATKAKKKSKEDYDKERKDILKDIKDKWKGAGGGTLTAVPVPYAAQLYAIAPDVSKLVRSYVEEGVDKLSDLIDKVHETISEVIPEITKNDVTDLVAGDYNKRVTRNQLAAKVYELQQEAKLIKKLQALESGEMPSTPEKVVERNARIKELRDKIESLKNEKRLEEQLSDLQNRIEKELKGTEPHRILSEKGKQLKAAIEAEKNAIAIEKRLERLREELAAIRNGNTRTKQVKNGSVSEEEKSLRKEISDERKKLWDAKRKSAEYRLTNAINRNIAEAKKILKKIENKEFEPEESKSLTDNLEFKRSNPKLYNKLINAIHAKEEAKHEFAIALHKDELAKRGKVAKIGDFIGDAIGTTKAVVTGIDLSATFIQNAAYMFSHPIRGGQAFGTSISHLTSEKRFNRWLTAIHNSAFYDLMQKAGLDITEPSSLLAKEKEEIFDRNLLSKTYTIGGKKFNPGKYTTKPFERAFTSMGNVIRVKEFLSVAAKYYREGRTIENSEKLFQDLAKLLNTQTGRGTLPEWMQRNAKIISLGIWSPRLMASRFNLLGIGDVGWRLFTLGKKGGFYTNLESRVRNKAMFEMVRFISSVVGIYMVAAFIWGGDDDEDFVADLNPQSVTFGDFKIGNKSYNLFGGFSQYVKLMFLMASGSRKMGEDYEDITDTKGKSRADLGFRFLRGKVTPVAGVIWDYADSKDFMGKPVTHTEQAKKLLTPLSLRDIKTNFERDGFTAAVLNGGVAITGIGVKDERDYFENPFEGTKEGNFLADNKLRLPRTNVDFLTVPVDEKHPDGKMTEAEFSKFKELKEAYIKADIKTLMEAGERGEIPVERDADVVEVSLKDLSKTELEKLISSISSSASQRAKEKLFPKSEETEEADKAKSKAGTKLSKILSENREEE
jgi:hypothetical protein